MESDGSTMKKSTSTRPALSPRVSLNLQGLVPRKILQSLQDSEEKNRKEATAAKKWVEDAIRDPYVWVTEHTKTYNEHWKTEKRPSSTEHFPKLEYFRVLFNVFDLEEIHLGREIPRHDGLLGLCGLLHARRNENRILRHRLLQEPKPTFFSQRIRLIFTAALKINHFLALFGNAV
jgi:hypothetical protein